MRAIHLAAGSLASLLLIATLGRADIYDDLKQFFQGRAIPVEITNNTKESLYVYLDATGRHGEGVAMDKVAGPDGAAMPPGLIIQPGRTGSFGDAVAKGDPPTINFVRYNEVKKMVTGDAPPDKITPEDYGPDVMKLGTPAVRVLITDAGIKVKGS